MNKFTLTFAAAIVALSGTAALADQSAMNALSSTNSVGFVTVDAPAQLGIIAGSGAAEQVDLGSLRARIQQNASIYSQLQSYGSSLDDVIGVSGTSASDVTIYVRS